MSMLSIKILFTCDYIYIYIKMVLLFGVAWLDLGGWGQYKLVSEPMVLALNLDGPRMWNLKLKFHRELMYRVPEGN
jgi:hypothetical protein